jgi:DNA helicase HerA-like ATPase
MKHKNEIKELANLSGYRVIDLDFHGNYDYIGLRKKDSKKYRYSKFIISARLMTNGYCDGVIIIPNIDNPLKYAKELAYIYLSLTNINTDLYFKSEFKKKFAGFRDINFYSFLYNPDLSDKLIDKKDWDRIHEEDKKLFKRYIDYLKSR